MSRSGTPLAPSPGAGSDVSSLTTNYKRRDGKIYLNGTKTFITSSKGVKWLVIAAKNADDPSVFTEFMVDMSKPGVELAPLNKLGLRMDSCCEVYLNDVELEESDIFGKEGNGFNRGIGDFNFERWLVGACDYGTAICAYEDALSMPTPVRHSARPSVVSSSTAQDRRNDDQARRHEEHAFTKLHGRPT